MQSYFCLTARKETLLKRLAMRQHKHAPAALAWIEERFECCILAFASPAFALQISTDEKSPEEIVEEILNQINLSGSFYA